MGRLVPLTETPGSRVPLWNDVLVAYLFNADRAGRIVSLGLESHEIEEAAKRGELDGATMGDFIGSLRGDDAKGLVTRAANLHRAWRAGSCAIPEAAPRYVAHLVLLAHAVLVGSGPAHQVHGKVNQLLGLPDGNVWPFDELADLWLDLEEWANVVQGGELGRFVPYAYGEQRWVAYLRGQALLTPRDRAALTALFAGQGLPPGSGPSLGRLESALLQGVRDALLPPRIERVLTSDSDGRLMLLNEVADELREWDGVECAPDHRGGVGARRSNVRLVLAVRGGIPIRGQSLPTLGLRMRVPNEADFDLGDGLELHFGGETPAIVTTSPRLPEGWSNLLVEGKAQNLVEACAVGWPGDIRLESAGLRASRPSSDRAILRQPIWGADLVEADDASEMIFAGQRVVLLATDVGQLLTEFSCLPPAAEWVPVTRDSPVSWVSWTATRDLGVGELLKTARVAGGAWVQARLWPPNHRSEHLMEVPLLVTGASHEAVLDGQRVTLSPTRSGNLRFDPDQEGALTLDAGAGGRRRVVHIRDLGVVRSSARVSPSGESATSGIAGAWLEGSAASPVSAASSPPRWCVHGYRGSDVDARARTGSALLLAMLSSWGKPASWIHLKGFVGHLAAAGFEVAAASRYISAMSALGHVQLVTDSGSAAAVVAAPPTLVRLPDHASTMVLCGARNHSLLTEVLHAAGSSGAQVWSVAQSLPVWDREAKEWIKLPAPPSVFIEGDGDSFNADLQGRLGWPLLLAPAPAAASLIEEYEPIPSRHWVWKAPTTGAWDGWKAAVFDRGLMTNKKWFRAVQRDSLPDFDAGEFLPSALYLERHGQRHCFLIDELHGQVQFARSSDFETAVWAALVSAGETEGLLFYDKPARIAGIRYGLPLPWLLDRALTLCSGFLPLAREHGEREDQVKVNCYLEVPERLFEDLASRLGVPEAHVIYRDLV